MSLEPLDGEAIDGGRVRSLRRGFDSGLLREGVLHPRDADQREAQIQFTSADIATVHKRWSAPLLIERLRRRWKLPGGRAR
jgi:hypothetical protein